MPPLSTQLHLCRSFASPLEGRDELTVLRTTVSSTALVIHLWVVIQSCVRPEGKLKAFLNSNYRGITHIVRLIALKKVDDSSDGKISF